MVIHQTLYKQLSPASPHPRAVIGLPDPDVRILATRHGVERRDAKANDMRNRGGDGEKPGGEG